MQKGIVCKTTGEPATFTTTCPDFDGKPQEAQTKSTQNEPAEIKGFFGFYLFWSIPIGVILTLIRTFATFDSSAYASSDFLLAFDMFFTAFYVVTCIYVIYAFVKCKPDAVFMAKFQLLMLFLSNVIVVISGETENTSFTGIIWSIIFFLYVCFSDDVKDRIPKETRKLTKFTKIFFPASLITVCICFLIGLAEVFNGHSLFADPGEKIEDMCKVASTALPDGELHSMYVDNNSLVYGLDSEFGELSSNTIERLGVTLRENMLCNFNEFVDEDSKEFFDLCVQANFDVTYKFTDRNAGTCVTVVIPSEQLAEAIEPGYVHTITSDSWNEALELYNAECPRLYFTDCYLENVSLNQLHNTIRFDLKLVNISTSTLNSLTTGDFKSHMKSIFETVKDDVMNMVDYCGYDIEYSFTADCLSWWSKSVVLEHNEMFEYL